MEDFDQFGPNPMMADKSVPPIYAEALSGFKILLHIKLVVLLCFNFNNKNQIDI